MQAIDGLEPPALWRAFDEISAIPRESRHEKKIRDFIIQRARALGHSHACDAAGNIVVRLSGSGSGTPLILQAHLDMVCEKTALKGHDFGTDPITLVREGDYLRADGTTLGADNGIGLAAMLVLMEDDSLPHPPLELLFTVDEETGLTGAYALDPGLIQGRRLINLDSEEDGVLCIGCAGGIETELELDLERITPPAGMLTARLTLGGLRGGHSGTDIHEGRGNAIALMARLLDSLNSEIAFLLVDLSGGSKHNAIPRESQALILTPPEGLTALEEGVSRLGRDFARELIGIEEGLVIRLHREDVAFTQALSAASTRDVTRLLHVLPHGVMQPQPGGTVMTSTNLAICQVCQGVLKITTSQRSFLSSSSRDIAERILHLGSLAGARGRCLNAYPAWEPDDDSALLAQAQAVYRSLNGREARIKVIHAGLECAVIADSLPEMDMLSLGPDIEQAHSPTERVSIPSVGRFWDFLRHLLERLERS